MGRLDDQAIALTGGGSGLGLAVVERFVAEGARVAVLDRSAEGCALLESRFGDAVTTVQGDVRSASDNERLIEAAVTQFGKLDCAVGNAGIWDYNKRLVDMTRTSCWPMANVGKPRSRAIWKWMHPTDERFHQTV